MFAIKLTLDSPLLVELSSSLIRDLKASIQSGSDDIVVFHTVKDATSIIRIAKNMTNVVNEHALIKHPSKSHIFSIPQPTEGVIGPLSFFRIGSPYVFLTLRTF